MPPTHLSPSAKPLKSRNLTVREREDIALECARGTGIRAIARKLGRPPSTISREIRRNSATRSGDFDYRAIAAQWHADRAARRPKASKLATNPALRDDVQDRLAGLISTPDGVAFDGPVVVWKGRRAVHRQSRRWSKAWSPEQIARRVRLDFPEDATMRISHEAIYQALYIQGRGALKRERIFVMQSANLRELAVRRMTFEIGRYKHTITLPPVRNEEQTISLAKEPSLLTALMSRAQWASLSTAGARLEHSRGFDLINARELISQLRRACRK